MAENSVDRNLHKEIFIKLFLEKHMIYRFMPFRLLDTFYDSTEGSSPTIVHHANLIKTLSFFSQLVLDAVLVNQ